LYANTQRGYVAIRISIEMSAGIIEELLERKVAAAV
jgi:hypothetical protein